MTDRHLNGRKAWVTGGASGQGRACALRLAEAGADVALGSLLSPDRRKNPDLEDMYFPGDELMKSTRAEIESHGVGAIGSDLDVRSPESVAAFYDLVCAEWGQVDILINAAGTWAEHPVCEHPEDLWQSVIDTNLNGPFHTIRACLPGMIERRWGRIVNICSTLATSADENAHTAAYSASKAGLLGLTNVTALEGAAHGVTCNAISPGAVDSGFTDTYIERWIARNKAAGQPTKTIDEYKVEIGKVNPQNRLIQPEEIANVAVFLCGEDSYGITMQDILVSAGSPL